MKPILEIHSISKKFKISHEQRPYLSLRDSISSLFNDRSIKEDFWALKDVSFNVMPGDTVGIIGKNGAGKSTLLKILSKITPPTSGKIIGRGRIASLLEVGTGFHPELSGRENIFMNGSILGMKHAEIQRNFDAIVDFAGVEKFLDTPLKHYSSGMQLRLAFAVAAFLENEILIIDEVLAVGDAEFQKKCIGKMEDVSKNGRTVLFVSHQMSAVKSICKSLILLENGNVQFKGNVIEGINRYYLKSKENYVEFDHIVKSLSVIQQKEMIKIDLEYYNSSKTILPHFGFVIYDSHFLPIFGSNPTLEGLELKKNNKEEGVSSIRVNIYDTVLCDGEYSVSIWFGDGKFDFFYQPHCIRFVVSGMSARKNHQNIILGNIIPKTTWEFKY